MSHGPFPKLTVVHTRPLLSEPETEYQWPFASSSPYGVPSVPWGGGESPTAGESFPWRRDFSNWRRKSDRGGDGAGTRGPRFWPWEPRLLLSYRIWPALRHVGKMITLQRNHDSSRSRYSRRSARASPGPDFSNSPSSPTTLVICGPPWSCARGCSPQIKALLQPGHLASCLRTRKAVARLRALPSLLPDPRHRRWM